MLGFISDFSGWRDHPFGFGVRFLLFESRFFGFAFGFCFSIVGFGTNQFVDGFGWRIGGKAADLRFALRLFALRFGDMLRERGGFVFTQAYGLLHLVEFVRMQKF
jgi:hypothetical protein